MGFDYFVFFTLQPAFKNMKNTVFSLLFLLFSTFFPNSLHAQPMPIIKLECINVGFHTQVGQNPNNPNTIIPESQLITLLDTLALYTKCIRTFGVDTNLQKVPRLAKERGLKVIVGIWISGDLTENEKQIKKGIEIAKAGYADRLIVGSEVLLRKNITPSKLIEYITRVKQACPDIPVSTADVYDVLTANPAVIAACASVDVNIYPFWECIPIECALQRFHQAYLSVLPFAGDKKIWISESGWKSRGTAKGEAIPSLENAIRYNRELLGWSKAFGVEVNLFEAFDEPWKGVFDDGWGLFDNNGKIKPGMEVLFKPIEKIDSTWLCKKINIPNQDTFGISYTPPKGVYQLLKGYVNLLNPCDYKVAIYIKVGGWWTKPTFAQPTVPVLCNGRWNAEFITGGNDVNATDICVFLIPATYNPPACSNCASIPPAVYQNAIAWRCINRPPVTTGNILVSKDTICRGDTVTLSAIGGPHYLWSNQQTTATIKVSPLGTTTYSVTVADGKGGGSTATATINIRPATPVTITSDPANATVCQGEKLSFTAAGGVSYYWSTGQTTSTISIYPIVSNHFIWVTATDQHGCKNVKPQTFNIHQLPYVKITSSLKKNYSIGDAAVKLYGTPAGGTFSGTGVSRDTFIPSKAGIGTHTIYYAFTNENGCKNIDSVSVLITTVSTGGLLEKVLSLLVSPNPTSGPFTISWNGSPSGFLITIYDMSGRLISMHQGNSTVANVDLSGATSGVYAILLTTPKFSARGKVVIR